MKLASVAMRNLAYFAANFPHDFIEKAWAKRSSDIKHIKQKFSTAYAMAGPKGAMLAFIWELSHDNQEILFDWIAENYSYTGVKQKEVLIDSVTSAWRERVGFQDYNRSSKKYTELQAEFFLGAMSALGIQPPLWIFSIMGGRDIITEWENILGNDHD